MATLTSYNFTQQVDYPMVLTDNIQESSISIAIDHIDTSGSGSSMTVTVWFKDVLSTDDQTTLGTVMTAYINSNPVVNPVLSVVQILGADSVTLCPFGSTFVAHANQTTNYDLLITNQIYIKGGIMYSSPGNIGDNITVQIVDKTNMTGQGGTSDNPTILATYVNNWYVIPQEMNSVEDVSLSEPMPAGLYIRFLYTNTSANIDSQIIINLLAYRGNE